MRADKKRIGFIIFSTVMADFALNLSFLLLICAAENQDEASRQLHLVKARLAEAEAAATEPTKTDAAI